MSLHKFLRLPQVIEHTGKKKGAIYKAIKDGKFPRQINNGGVVVWLESEILEWQENLLKQRTNDNNQPPSY